MGFEFASIREIRVVHFRVIRGFNFRVHPSRQMVANKKGSRHPSEGVAGSHVRSPNRGIHFSLFIPLSPFL